MTRIVLTLAVLTGAALSLGQTAVAPTDQIVSNARSRIAALNERLQQIRAFAQKQADAANCRVGCPPEVSRRIGDGMTAALNEVTTEIHAEVDAFIRRTIEARDGGFHSNRIVNGFQRILPDGEPRSVFRGRATGGDNYLIATYVVHKGGVMGTGATSVALRAYNERTSGSVLSDVTGSDMDGYARVVVTEVRPLNSDPTRPVQETFLLVSGYMTGANGPNNRMRLYAYNGSRFRTVWMPANEWGQFEVRATTGGFTVVGNYYRESGTRNESYAVTEDGLYKRAGDQLR